jgi:hypothetical protein
VLDNGVTSSEFWRILDCEEGLDWCVFYYSGAASRAGLSYSGAILASRSGDWPQSQVGSSRFLYQQPVAAVPSPLRLRAAPCGATSGYPTAGRLVASSASSCSAPRNASQRLAAYMCLPGHECA